MKLLRIVISAFIILLSSISMICFGQLNTNANQDNEGFLYDNPNIIEPGTHTELGDGFGLNINNDKSLLNKLLGVFGLDSGVSDQHKFLTYLKAILNIALGLLSFIALVILIYTFYMMFFTENDAGVKKAIGNLKGVFIALAVIGLSWLIVSFIFWWYQDNWQNANITFGNNVRNQNLVVYEDSNKHTNNIYLNIL